MHLNISKKLGCLLGCVSLVFLGGCKEENPWDFAFQSVATFAQSEANMIAKASPRVTSPDSGEVLDSQHYCIELDMASSQPDRPNQRVDQITLDLAGKVPQSQNITYCETVAFICEPSQDCTDTPQYRAGLNYIQNELGRLFEVQISASEAFDLNGEPLTNGSWVALPASLSETGISLLQAEISHYAFIIKTINPSQKSTNR